MYFHLCVWSIGDMKEHGFPLFALILRNMPLLGFSSPDCKQRIWEKCCLPSDQSRRGYCLRQKLRNISPTRVEGKLPDFQPSPWLAQIVKASPCLEPLCTWPLGWVVAWWEPLIAPQRRVEISTKREGETKTTLEKRVKCDRSVVGLVIIIYVVINN